MANPSKKWDGVPVWGVWLNPITEAPSLGSVTLTVSSRIARVDGRAIYPEGATITVEIGNTDHQDPAVRVAIRDALRAVDQAALGGDFDGLAWDQWWETVCVPAAIFTRFPASDDPDIAQTGFSVQVTESLKSGKGRSYPITPLLAHLTTPVPGVNLNLVEQPPGAPTSPAPMYAKGIPGGVASLDDTGKVPTTQLPEGFGGGGGGSVTSVAADPLPYTDAPTISLTAGLLRLGIPGGAPGSKGDKGDAGVTSVTSTTLPHTSPATVSLAGGTLALGIPGGAPGAKGDKGDKGDTGPAPAVMTVASLNDALGAPAGTWVLVTG